MRFIMKTSKLEKITRFWNKATAIYNTISIVLLALIGAGKCGIYFSKKFRLKRTLKELHIVITCNHVFLTKEYHDYKEAYKFLCFTKEALVKAETIKNDDSVKEEIEILIRTLQADKNSLEELMKTNEDE